MLWFHPRNTNTGRNNLWCRVSGRPWGGSERDLGVWGAHDVAFLLDAVTLLCKFIEQNSSDVGAFL